MRGRGDDGDGRHVLGRRDVAAGGIEAEGQTSVTKLVPIAWRLESSSGSDFVTGMSRGRIDMATPYLREALRFIGITRVRFVLIGPTAGPAEPVRAACEAAHRRLAEIAGSF